MVYPGAGHFNAIAASRAAAAVGVSGLTHDCEPDIRMPGSAFRCFNRGVSRVWHCRASGLCKSALRYDFSAGDIARVMAEVRCALKRRGIVVAQPRSSSGTTLV